MEDSEGVLSLPQQMLDRVLDLLSKVGIDLAALAVQLFLLTLVLVSFVVAARRLRGARDSPSLASWLAVTALGLVAAGIVIGVVDQARLPDRVLGRLDGIRPGIHVELLDFRGQRVSPDSGGVDSETGVFVLHYRPIFDGRARRLRVSAPGCEPDEKPIPRALLRAKGGSSWVFECKPRP